MFNLGRRAGENVVMKNPNIDIDSREFSDLCNEETAILIGLDAMDGVDVAHEIGYEEDDAICFQDRKRKKKDAAISNKVMCSSCGESNEEKLMQCSQCKTTYYCNRTCQKSHWKEHRKVCGGGRVSCCSLWCSLLLYLRRPSQNYY